MKCLLLHLLLFVLFAYSGFGQKFEEEVVFDIVAGDSVEMKLVILDPVTLKGTFTSNDNREDLTVAATEYLRIDNTIQNNIELLVLDERNYSARSGGRSFMSLFNSGKVTMGNFEVPLRPGIYRFIISNRHSLLAGKQVKLKLDSKTKAILEGRNDATLQTSSNSFLLLDHAFVVPAGKAGFFVFPFTVPRPSRIHGRFATTGGNNDIDFIVVDALNFERWSRGLYYSFAYKTGYVSGEQVVDVSLNPGRWYFIFDNRVSLVTRKRVVTNFQISPLLDIRQ